MKYYFVSQNTTTYKIMICEYDNVSERVEYRALDDRMSDRYTTLYDHFISIKECDDDIVTILIDDIMEYIIDNKHTPNVCSAYTTYVDQSISLIEISFTIKDTELLQYGCVNIQYNSDVDMIGCNINDYETTSQGYHILNIKDYTDIDSLIRKTITTLTKLP